MLTPTCQILNPKQRFSMGTQALREGESFFMNLVPSGAFSYTTSNGLDVMSSQAKVSQGTPFCARHRKKTRFLILEIWTLYHG